jgi:CheY-like chemotaxis protein
VHVLIVEDDELVRRALERVLVREGYSVCWAASGASAIGLLDTEPIDLVLLDLRLGPGISGWDVARYKVEHERLRHVPMIVMSGIPTEEIHARAANPLQGAMLILSKPIDIELLLRAIHSLAGLDGHRASLIPGDRPTPVPKKP